MAKILVETYRGCKIYKYTPPDTPETEYGSPCITGLFYKIDAVRKRICQATGGQWVLGACEDVAPPPPPPVQEPYLEEVYRGVEIWWVPAISAFRAVVAPGYVAVATSLVEIRAQIDEILEFLYPPEDPTAGLFAQVVVAVKAWIQDNMPGWVLEWGQNIYNTINNIVENITNVYQDLRTYVMNVYQDLRTYVTNVYNDFREYVTNVYNNTYEYITQNITNITQNITNIIGASVEWVEERLADNREWTVNFFKLMDPMGFLKDPLGYINAAFAIQGEIAQNLAMKSFWEGFEEGLAEEAEG